MFVVVDGIEIQFNVSNRKLKDGNTTLILNIICINIIENMFLYVYSEERRKW